MSDKTATTTDDSAPEQDGYAVDNSIVSVAIVIEDELPAPQFTITPAEVDNSDEAEPGYNYYFRQLAKHLTSASIREHVIAVLVEGSMHVTEQRMLSGRRTIFGTERHEIIHNPITRTQAAEIIDAYLRDIKDNARQLEAAFPALRAMEALAHHSYGMPHITRLERYGLLRRGIREVSDSEEAFSWLNGLYQGFLSH